MEQCIDKQRWEVGEGSASFLQSWEWGEFQRSVGNEPIRLIGQQGERVQGLLHALPFGQQYLYLPHAILSTDEILAYAATQGWAFVRIDPYQPLPEAIQKKGIPIRSRQPQHTLILDLQSSEQDILAGMHKKTRYNIKLAGRKGVIIHDQKDLETFWHLMQETTARDGFASHSKSYYDAMLALPFVDQRTAFVEGVPVASHIFVGYGNTYTYLHGASSYAHRACMAPFLLQWSAIQYAKTHGYEDYDMWGVAPPAASGEQHHTYMWDGTHSLSGVTRYKAGFGGRPHRFGQSYDLPVNRMVYTAYRWGRKIRSFV